MLLKSYFVGKLRWASPPGSIRFRSQLKLTANEVLGPARAPLRKSGCGGIGALRHGRCQHRSPGQDPVSGSDNQPLNSTEYPGYDASF